MSARVGNFKGYVRKGHSFRARSIPSSCKPPMAQIIYNECCYCQHFLYETFPTRARSDLLLISRISVRNSIGLREVAKRESQRE